MSASSLAIALAFLRDPAFPTEPRARIEALGSLGWRAIQLDATAPGLRPRDLDASARRDLPAMLARRGVVPTGLDFIIPPTDFADPARSQRAVDAMAQAIALAGDWRRALAAPVVVTELAPDTPPDVLHAITRVCEQHGITLADLAKSLPRDQRQTEGATAPGSPSSKVGACFDPARVIASGRDPIDALIALGRAPQGARLTDFAGGFRVEPASRASRLDIPAYRAALATLGFAGPVVVELRGLADQPGAAARLAALA